MQVAAPGAIIIDQWDEIRALVDSMDLDIRKNARGNMSAGIRARKGLRLLKSFSASLVKTTVAEEKRRKSEK